MLGGEQQRIDLADLRRHIHYSGGYHESQPIIAWFWEVRARVRWNQIESNRIDTSCDVMECHRVSSGEARAAAAAARTTPPPAR